MNKPTSKNMSQYLHSDHKDLQAIFTKIKMLAELNQQISIYLDPAVAKYCQAANLIGNTLIVITANASIATQLRYQSANLLKQFSLQPTLKHIKHLEFKVRPTSQTYVIQQSKTKNMSLLSPMTAEIIREIAGSLEDPKLREIMERIASRTKD